MPLCATQKSLISRHGVIAYTSMGQDPTPYSQHRELYTFSTVDLLQIGYSYQQPAAPQTVRRPPAFYAHLMPFEALPIAKLPQQLQPLLGY